MQRYPFLAILLLLHPVLATSVAAQENSWYVEPGSYSTQRESETPRYARNLGTVGGPAAVDFGIDYRFRYESRDDDLRRAVSAGLDQPLLQRTRVFAGLQASSLPLQFVAEFEDARRSHSDFAKDDRDVNEMEFIQAYAKLDLRDALGADTRGNARPLTLHAGRMAFELLDRRLIARNEWRNTTNNFDGLRLSLGQQHNDWQLQVMRLHPVARRLTGVDKSDLDQRFDVLTGHWRRWSSVVTLEPHYLRLRQQASQANGMRERDIRGYGLRASGKLLESRFNYDVSGMQQHGDDRGQEHEAQSYLAELGYTWTHPWQPRLSVFHGRASGDANPLDSENNRFDRFFGFARPWSSSDYIIYENLRTEKLRVEFQPRAGVRMDLGIGRYRLDSAKDRLANLLAGSAFNRDVSGLSGTDIGTELDARVRFSPAQHVGVNIGYSHFRHGDFVRLRQQAANKKSSADSDFLYLELTLSLF
jgi:hypothetical protein